jgi:hypothetical protein
LLVLFAFDAFLLRSAGRRAFFLAAIASFSLDLVSVVSDGARVAASLR